MLKEFIIFPLTFSLKEKGFYSRILISPPKNKIPNPEEFSMKMAMFIVLQRVGPLRICCWNCNVSPTQITESSLLLAVHGNT